MRANWPRRPHQSATYANPTKTRRRRRRPVGSTNRRRRRRGESARQMRIEARRRARKKMILMSLLSAAGAELQAEREGALRRHRRRLRERGQAQRWLAASTGDWGAENRGRERGRRDGGGKGEPSSAECRQSAFPPALAHAPRLPPTPPPSLSSVARASSLLPGCRPSPPPPSP